MATRGATGGLAHAALDAVDILDVAGFDTVIIETVGVGPGRGRDRHAPRTRRSWSRRPGLATRSRRSRPAFWRSPTFTSCRKCDRRDANRTIVDLKQMLMLGAWRRTRAPWTIPVIGDQRRVAATDSTSLLDAIERHREVAFTTPRPGATPRCRSPSSGCARPPRTCCCDRFAERFANGDGVACRQAHAAREPTRTRRHRELLQRSNPARIAQGARHEPDARSKIA